VTITVNRVVLKSHVKLVDTSGVSEILSGIAL
jgi:hypothetical protein